MFELPISISRSLWRVSLELHHFDHIFVENHPNTTFWLSFSWQNISDNVHQNDSMFHRYDILKHDWCLLGGSNWSRATRIGQNVRHHRIASYTGYSDCRSEEILTCWCRKSVFRLSFSYFKRFGLKDIVRTSIRHWCLSVAMRNSQG